MLIKLSISEFVVALFGLNPNQCKLTFTGRIANAQGLAYQVQSLLCDKIKIRYRSYRSRTATLGTETSESTHTCTSPTTARFSIDTLIGELANFDLSPTNGVAALFGKDEAWSWRLPIMVFITAAIFFSTLIVWNLSKAPIYNPKEFFGFVVGVIFLSLLCCLFFPKILRRILDIPLPGRKFETSIEMSVLRAEIIHKIKALPPEMQKLGVTPLILKFIDDNKSQAPGHTIAELREELDHLRQGFSEEKKKNSSLLARQKELQSQNDELKTKDEALEAEKKALSAEIKATKQSSAMLENLYRKALSELGEEKKAHASDVRKFKEEKAQLSAVPTRSDFENMGIVLGMFLAFAKEVLGINQATLVDYIQRVHMWYEKKFDTRLQACTVERIFAIANKLLRSRFKGNPCVVPELINEAKKFHQKK